MITKDLGMVTAYAYAVSKGYTGTEEEFAELMASYASVAQEAVDAALAAAQSAQSAQSAKTAAESARDTAQTTVSGAIAGIQAEGQTQIGAVQAEGTTQVGNVNTAGQTQVSAVQAKGTEVLNSIPADYTELSGKVTDLKNDKADVIVSSASGAIARFSDGADGLPIKSLTVAIELVQEGSGNPSPDNVRPITGWTAAKVNRTGKNLFGGSLMMESMKASMPSATINEEERTIKFSAGATIDTSFDKFCGLLKKYKENTQYTFIVTVLKNSGLGINMRVYYTDSTYENLGAVSEEGEKETIVFVSAPNKTIRSFTKTNQNNTTTVYVDESGVFEGVLTAEDFEPYAGQTCDIELPTEAGTVYGGTLDVSTGELIVDRKLVTVSSNGIASGSSNYCRFEVGPLGYVDPSKGQYCNLLFWFEGAASSLPVGSFKVIDSPAFNTAHVILCFDGCRGSTQSGTRQLNIAKLQELEEAGTPMQVCFGLATPLTYTLTPTEIRTFLGENNVWADAGDVDVSYRADTKLYIDGKITEAIANALNA